MIYRLKQVAIILMFIGIIGVCLNMLFGYNTVSYIQTYYNEAGIKFYKYDFKSYIENIVTQIGNTARLELSKPTRTWETGEWGAITNDLALILDWLIFLVNIIVYPLRIGGYIIQNLWAILGITYDPDVVNGLDWLYELSYFLQNLQIPYV